ncbi:MAG: hypothetical protein Q7S32_01405 [bacterium]|nr:hypothetical protein [bacterium]
MKSAVYGLGLFIVLIGLSPRQAYSQQGQVISIKSYPNLRASNSGGVAPGGLYVAVSPITAYNGVPTVYAKQNFAGPWYAQQTLAYPASNSVAFFLAKGFAQAGTTYFQVQTSSGDVTGTVSVQTVQNDPAIYTCAIPPQPLEQFVFTFDGIYGLCGGPLRTIGKCANPQTPLLRGSKFILQGGGFALNVVSTPIITATIQGIPFTVLRIRENPLYHHWDALFEIPQGIPIGSQQVVLTVNGKTFYLIMTFG